MKENDPFEARLQKLPPRTPPPEWRTEILQRAASAANPVAARRGPPRWLAVGWAAGIAATVLLHLTHPARPGSENFTPPHVSASPASFKSHAQLIEAWLAQHHSNAAYPKP